MNMTLPRIIFCSLALTLFILCMTTISAADDQDGVTIGERSFTIQTSRLRARFEDGVIVSLHNRITGEDHAAPVADENDLSMPRGMGHLRGGVKAVEKLHIPWHVSSMVLAEKSEIQETPRLRDFSPFYHPLSDSHFSTRRIPHGVEATWRGLGNGQQSFPDDVLVIRAWVDANTDQLLFSASSTSVDRGVISVQVPIINLGQQHRFYIPSFGGVMLDRQMTTGVKTFRGLCNFLEARVLGIEGDRGSIGLWAQDEKFHNHHLFFNWSGRSFSVAFDHQNLMPFEQHDHVDSVVYHLDGFAGSSVDAMTPYRKWYQEQFANEIVQRGDVDWADRIRVIIDSSSATADVDAKIAEMLAPDTVMFHQWNARQAAFDQELPDWSPREGYAERVAALQALGFRTMAYVNTYCVNFSSPVFRGDHIADFGLTRKMQIGNYGERRVDENQQSQWQGFDAGELLYLDPLSARWRSFHTDQMIAWQQQTGTDANYEDVLGTAGDFGNGVIDGLFAGQGAAAQVQELLARNGGAAMASEYAPENIAFGVRWPLSYLTVWGSDATRRFWTHRSRPVSAYIHGPDLRPWVPILRADDNLRRYQVMAWSDALGGLAQLHGHPVALNAKRGALALLNERARLFSSLQLEPHFEQGRHDRDLVCFYHDLDGGIYRYEATPTRQQMIGPDGKPLYQQIQGHNSFASPLMLPGWPARIGQTFIGLNPDVGYPLLPATDDDAITTVHVVGLSASVMVRRYYDTDDVVVLVLESTREAPQAQGQAQVELRTHSPIDTLLINDVSLAVPVWDASQKRSAVTTYNVDLPARFIFIKKDVPPSERGYVGDKDLSGHYMMPDEGLDVGVDFPVTGHRPWAVPDVAGSGEPGNEIFHGTSGLEQVTFDYLIGVPDASTSLKLYLNNAQNQYGNGVIASISLNGRLVRGYDFGPISNPDEEPGTPPEQRSRWPDQNVHLWQIPLGEFAGQPVLISLGTDPKGSNNADNFWLSRPILVTDDAQETRFIILTPDGEVVEEPLRASNNNERLD